MAASAPQKFGFDTCFDEAGRVVSTAAPRPRRTYLAAEVEALQAQAFAEGQAAQRVSDEGRRAQALADIADACRQALPMLNQVIEAHRAQAASLALATGEAVASAALERFPAGPLQAALEALGQEIDASPRLVIRTGDLDDANRARITRLCDDSGFSGVVAFREEPGLAPAAFQLEWADGRAAFDADEAFIRIGEALASALAAEAGHAEPLTPDTSLEGRP